MLPSCRIGSQSSQAWQQRAYGFENDGASCIWGFRALEYHGNEGVWGTTLFPAVYIGHMGRWHGHMHGIFVYIVISYHRHKSCKPTQSYSIQVRLSCLNEHFSSTPNGFFHSTCSACLPFVSNPPSPPPFSPSPPRKTRESSTHPMPRPPHTLPTRLTARKNPYRASLKPQKHIHARITIPVRKMFPTYTHTHIHCGRALSSNR